MFCHRFFGTRAFGPTYFGPIASSIIPGGASSAMRFVTRFRLGWKY